MASGGLWRWADGPGGVTGAVVAVMVESVGMDWAAGMACRVACGVCGECEERG